MLDDRVAKWQRSCLNGFCGNAKDVIKLEPMPTFKAMGDLKGEQND